MARTPDASALSAPLVAPLADGLTVTSPDEARFVRGPRAYRVRGLARALSAEALRLTVRVSLGERVFVDTLDLYQARGRSSFAKGAAVELGLAEEVIAGDLSALVLGLEPVQEALMRGALKPEADGAEPVLSAADEAAGLALLRDPALLERIALVGEALGGADPEHECGRQVDADGWAAVAAA
jgi:hypothetical protein